MRILEKIKNLTLSHVGIGDQKTKNGFTSFQKNLLGALWSCDWLERWTLGLKIPGSNLHEA